MTAKEYLGQAYRLDQRIDAKLEQVANLRALATKATARMNVLSGMVCSFLRFVPRRFGCCASALLLDGNLED